MRRITWVLAIVMCLALIVSGCGPKNAKNVVGDLGRKLEKLENYEAHAIMTLQTGQTPLEYDVEVWYQSPDYYRIALTNTKKDIKQIILRNDDGVFVLTPHLNKSFRFKSDWPESQGQVYLYQSLVKSILEDDNRNFEVQNDLYMFDVAANYQNKALARQKIWLTNDLLPARVEVLDTSNAAVVTLAFDRFNPDAKFDDDDFSMERNMTSELPNVTTMTEDKAEANFGIVEPTYMPNGVTLVGSEKINELDQVVLKFSGDYQYTIIESRPMELNVTKSEGYPVDLGYTVGMMTEEAGFRSMSWVYDGIEFTMTGNLPEDEMMNVAQSTFTTSGK